MTGKKTGQSIADVLGLLRAVRDGKTDMSSQAICHLSLDELYQDFIASLALLSVLADAMDEQRKAAGLDPVADTLLATLAANLDI